MTVVKVGAVILLLIGVCWLMVNSVSYNGERTALCREHGMEFGQIYFGEYGCVEFHPFEEFE